MGIPVVFICQGTSGQGGLASKEDLSQLEDPRFDPISRATDYRLTVKKEDQMEAQNEE